MSSITTIQSSDLITNSRAVINANFAALNNDKIETSVLDTDTTLAANSDARIATQKAVKAYVDAGGNANASTIQAGIVQEATQSQTDLRTGTGSTGSRLYINPGTNFPLQFDNAMFGETNDGSNPRGVTDDFNKQIFPTGTATYGIYDQTTGYYATRSVTSEYAAADRPSGLVIQGIYAYVMMTDSAVPYGIKVFRFPVNNLAGGGTEVTFSGQATGTTSNSKMSTDGTFFYFTFKAGGSASEFIISKYSLSGTVFTYISDITLAGSPTGFAFAVRASDGHIITQQASDSKFRRYNTSGVLQGTSTTGIAGMWGLSVGAAIFYLGFSDASNYVKYQRIVTLP